MHGNLLQRRVQDVGQRLRRQLTVVDVLHGVERAGEDARLTRDALQRRRARLAQRHQRILKVVLAKVLRALVEEHGPVCAGRRAR